VRTVTTHEAVVAFARVRASAAGDKGLDQRPTTTAGTYRPGAAGLIGGFPSMTDDSRDPADDSPGTKPANPLADPDPLGRRPGEPSADRADNKVARLHPPRIPHHPTLDRAVQGMIGAQLRSMYEHYVEQPIPDRLLDLVERLGQGAGEKRGPTDEGGA
jgi:hypothetical protein